MIVFLNGQFVPEEQAVVSVFDRSFLYGDGLFETLRVANGKPFRWEQHLRRLTQGSAFLGIRIPFASAELLEALTELVRLNNAPESVLRITLSRGVGTRGYSPRGANRPLVLMSLHPASPLTATPTTWKLFTASYRLRETDALAQWKTNNKLIQILARREAEEHGADEALLLNTQGEVCETSSGNVFWMEHGRLLTPPTKAGLLPGVTRTVVMELASTLGLAVVELRASSEALENSQGALVSLSTLGLVEITGVDGRDLPRTTQTQSLYNAYQRLVKDETA